MHAKKTRPFRQVLNDRDALIQMEERIQLHYLRRENHAKMAESRKSPEIPVSSVVKQNRSKHPLPLQYVHTQSVRQKKTVPQPNLCVGDESEHTEVWVKCWPPVPPVRGASPSNPGNGTEGRGAVEKNAWVSFGRLDKETI